MPSRLNPYISFPGTARDALEFYQRVFGGSLTLMTFAEAGAADIPEADQIMHGMLETDAGYTLMAADPPPGETYESGSNVAISLSGDDEEQLRSYWDQLSADGSVTVPLEQQMWGDVFGMCEDRFGIAWLVNIGRSPS